MVMWEMSIFMISKGSVGYSAHWNPQGALGWVQLHGYVALPLGALIETAKVSFADDVLLLVSGSKYFSVTAIH